MEPSEIAIKHDSGKPDFNLLPFDAIFGVQAVLDAGAKKYGSRNWELGMEWGRLISAALRHLFKFACGENNDSEDGLPHIDHAAACVLFLSAYAKRKSGMDNRRLINWGNHVSFTVPAGKMDANNKAI